MSLLLLICKMWFLLSALIHELLHHGLVLSTHLRLLSKATWSLTTILHSISLQGLVAIDMLGEVLQGIRWTTISAS